MIISQSWYNSKHSDSGSRRRDLQFIGWFHGDTHRDGTGHGRSRSPHPRVRNWNGVHQRRLWIHSRILALPGQVGGSMGTVTKVLWTTVEICDENSKRTLMMKTSAVLLRFPCAQSRAGFPLGSPKKCRDQRMIILSNARASAGRLEWFLRQKHMCKQFVARHMDDGLRLGQQYFLQRAATSLVHGSTSEEARDVGRRFTPLWKALNDRLRTEFIDNNDIVPSVDVRSQTENVADEKNGIVLTAIKFDGAGDEHLFDHRSKSIRSFFVTWWLGRNCLESYHRSQEASRCRRVAFSFGGSYW